MTLASGYGLLGSVDPVRRVVVVGTSLAGLRMALRDNILTAEVKADGLGGVVMDKLDKSIEQTKDLWKLASFVPAVSTDGAKQLDTLAGKWKVVEMSDAGKELSSEDAAKFGFTFDEKHDDDNVMEQNGITVVVDPQSATYLKDAKVDYVEDFRGAGFSVVNPNASGGCGCGKSFNA